jgi:hypothetical protein
VKSIYRLPLRFEETGMPNIDAIVREINRDLVPEFEKKLRAYLIVQDKDWLIEQIVRLTLDAHSLEEMDRRHFREQENRRKQEQVERVKKLELDMSKLNEFVERYQDGSRDSLIRGNLLLENTPAKGNEMITNAFRSSEGNELLHHAKDMLFGLLFGDETTSTQFPRTQRELLTLILPRIKAEALNFMKATTQYSATGTWQDPESGSGESQKDNVVLEVEYGETEDQAISRGILTALRLINDLEINEEVLYGRMEKIERSTLVS